VDAREEVMVLERCLRHLRRARSELLDAGSLYWDDAISEAVRLVDEAINRCNFRLTLSKNLLKGG